jgi:ABC-type transporter lipoprotein component MlaA
VALPPGRSPPHLTVSRAAFLLLVPLAGACSDIETRHRDWSAYDGPGVEDFRAPEPPMPEALEDPLQPANRAAYDFNVGLLRLAVQPAARGWRALTTPDVRRHLRQFGENMAFPVRLVSNLLQGELRRAGVEGARFLVNGTLGLLGVFDPATDLGLPAPRAEDVGRALGAWGWEPGAYVHLPVVGPSSDRDALGWAADAALDPATWLVPLKPLLLFNTLSDEVDGMLRVEASAGDGYEVVRTAFTLLRSGDVAHFGSPEPATPALRTLQAVFLDARDPGFLGRREARDVLVPATGRRLPYELWLREEPAPLVCVLPGLGGHRLGGQAVGLAEMAFEAGCSVATLSATLHPEFMQLAASGTLPGWLPDDVGDVLAALRAIEADVRAHRPGRVTRLAVAGLSMGALQALLLAARPEADDFAAIVAVNPPVSFENGLRRLDALYRAPLRFPEDERAARIRDLLLKVVRLAEGTLEPAAPLPLQDWEAEYLIGLSFRWTLRTALFESQLRANRGVLLTELDLLDREPAYREIDAYGFMEFAWAFLLPYAGERDPTLSGAGDLFARSSLLPLQARLAGDARLRVITNRDDFLLRPGDVDWLQRTLGERLLLFERGGHLGNLALPGPRLAVVEALRTALGLPGRPAAAR